MDFSGMFTTQGMMFLILMLGYLLSKSGMIPENGKKLLSDLTLNVTLPASIIKSFQTEFSAGIARSCAAIALVSLFIQVACTLFSGYLYPHMPHDRKRILQYSTVTSNAGILGSVVAQGIFGEMGLLYASIYLIPQRIFMWSVGMRYFTDGLDKKKILRQVALNPCIIAVGVGLVIMLFQVPLPAVLSAAVKNIASGNTLLAMLLVGNILAQVDLRTVPEWDTLYYSFVRLVLVPGIVLLCCRLAGMESLVTNVAVVLSGMPGPATAAALAAKYGCEEQFATKCVVLSTLLSLVTVPVWCLILA